MTGPEHYQRAEELLDRSDGDDPETAAVRVAQAQVHATLALAAATAMTGIHGMPYDDGVAWAKAAKTGRDA
ncbi:hypothetical protein BJF79_30670 [Actinomadura sp. CNU-125]|uniref:hypothetical protein n=1 Tax=Actinomadura sp. CNU-125 TaxID=1904961 RepID=UPI00095A22EE|nr:hypothetical protein [Actinomadura sp. CNU-125]OLT36737.1 hypothetical protein BJF79_30670 [Actinomadura sp. CNU-125]